VIVTQEVVGSSSFGMLTVDPNFRRRGVTCSQFQPLTTNLNEMFYSLPTGWNASVGRGQSFGQCNRIGGAWYDYHLFALVFDYCVTVHFYSYCSQSR
jgi:hypothetical protein